MNSTGLRKWLVGIAVCAVACAILGAAGLALRPTMYTSTASTSITVDSQAADASVLQGVTASIFMMMPVYAEQAKSDAVVQSAVQASGLTPTQVSQGLNVERTVDSTVLSWSFTAQEPEAATAALNAATQRFATLLRQAGPKSGKDQSLLEVAPAQATPASSGRLTPALGAVAGGLIGLMGALAAMLLFYRGRSSSISDWDEVEHLLGIPIAAELVGSPTQVQRQWGYAADLVSRGAGPGRVGLYGARSPVDSADANALETSLRGSDHHAREVTAESPLLSSPTVDATGLAGAVILLDPARATLQSVAPDCRALARNIVGPVVGVLDRRGRDR